MAHSTTNDPVTLRDKTLGEAAITYLWFRRTALERGHMTAADEEWFEGPNGFFSCGHDHTEAELYEFLRRLNKLIDLARLDLQISAVSLRLDPAWAKMPEQWRIDREAQLRALGLA